MNKRFKERIALADAYEFHPQYLLIAGPTCGKSTLIKKAKGLKINDTDDVIADFLPSWWTEHQMAPNVANYQSVAWLMRFLNAGSDEMWVTNLWGKDFLATLFEKVKYRKVPFFYREDPLEIQEIFLKLGKKPTDIKTLTQWAADHAKFAHLVSDKVIPLKRGQFISDFVTPSSNGWKLNF